jgi:hypothetical protein
VAAVTIRLGLLLLVCAGACSDDTVASMPTVVSHTPGAGELGGSFTTTGFEATVEAAVTRDGAADCDYSVSWVGTKSGEPNVIPG